MKTKLTFLALIIFFIAWFSFITPTDRFADPDAFYHITTAKLISERGPLTQCPWLDLTTLGQSFADQHFLFHVLQIPFLKIFEPLQAARYSAILFAIICMLGISIAFYKLKVTHWWLWPILLTLTQPFTTRLIQGKASPLAILLWFLGICAALLAGQSQSKKSISYQLLAISIISFLFTLTHGGWLLLPVSILLILLGDFVYGKFIHRHLNKARAQLSCGVWGIKYLIASITGCLLGLLVHPNRGEMFSFLKVQFFDVAIATPRILKMGTEWNTSSVDSIISMFGIFGIISLLVLLAKVLNKKNPNQNSLPGIWYPVRLAIPLLPLLVLLFIASIKSLRFTEYFQPLLALVTALLASTINWKQLINNLKISSAKYEIRNTKFDLLIPIIIVLALLIIPLQHAVVAYGNMHNAKRFLFNQYAEPMAAISKLAEPGNRVYHSMWDEFPILYYHNQDLHYVSGLDPTFLYKASSTLALDYQNLVFNTSSTQADAYSLIHDRLHADFLLIDYERWPHLAEVIASDPRYTILAEGDGAIAYKVSKD